VQEQGGEADIWTYREKVTGQNCILKSFMNCTSHYYLGDQIKWAKMSGEYSRHGGDEEYIKGFGGE
jgi:hypothetical protein